ncbi:LbetaH domain-containing protein [Desulfosoma caldarium]|uniref:Transferase family hexapeptide repeat protein n=1 Tax=Desulfosoma caldarium TaxID=610254 RepID=A0A3N1UJ47_9BACT|nr:hypothetical protein [Desulfosoma caldarium]ROQ89798.1 transferase family hexapeptide repeat protein [Desulfosoma caldarium]
MERLKATTLFDLQEFSHRDVFPAEAPVWETLSNLKGYLEQHLVSSIMGLSSYGMPLPQTVVLFEGRVWYDGFEILGGNVTKGNFRVRVRGQETLEATVLYAGSVFMDPYVQLGKGTVVEPGALIKGPTIIGNGTEIRQGAYLRGTCLVGDRCVVGHTTEVKGSIFLDGAKAGHFAYVGDSIVGRNVNLGAGTKLANLKIKGNAIRIRTESSIVDTGRRKLGAIIGDGTEIGCNAVTNPGTILGQKCLVFPLTSVPAGIYKDRSVIGGKK